MLRPQPSTGGDLGSVLRLRARDGGRLFGFWRHGCRVLYECATALNYLHARNCVHMDIKSSSERCLGRVHVETCGLAAARYAAWWHGWRRWHLCSRPSPISSSMPPFHADVLLTAHGVAKLTDVGLSRVQTKTYLSDLPSMVGTFSWVREGGQHGLGWDEGRQRRCDVETLSG